LKLHVLCKIIEGPPVKIDEHFIAFIYHVTNVRVFQNWETNVDGVPIEYFNARGACSLLDPHPKFVPATNIVLNLTFSRNVESRPAIAYFASSYGSV
jgi:hypothetical protein